MRVGSAIAANVLRRQVLLDLLAPPVLACTWWVLARMFAAGSEEGCTALHKTRLKQAFRVVLAALYATLIAVTVYHDVLR